MTKIICAAIWMKDFPTAVHNPRNIEKGVVIGGWRHHNIISTLNAMMGVPISQLGSYEQGFLTTEGMFVNREEAYKIAKEAGQILLHQEDEGKWELYSEDLY